MPLQSSGIIVVDKTSVISNLNNNQHQQQLIQQQNLQSNANILYKNSILSSSTPVVQRQQQLLQNQTAITLQKQQLAGPNLKQQHQTQGRGRNLNVGDDKSIGVQSMNNSSISTGSTKNLMRRNQRTISTSSSSNSSMNLGTTQTISALSTPVLHQQNTSTTKHIQFSSISQQHTYNTPNQMNQQQSQTTQHHIIQTAGGHSQVIVSEEYLEHATTTGAAQIVNISANDLINSQIIKLVSADGNEQNVLIDSLGNVTATTNPNNGSGSGGGTAGGNNNSKLLVSNLVLSSTSGATNVNTNKVQQLTAAGQPQQQINFVSAKQIPYLTTTTAGNVATKNQTIQKIVNIPLKTNNTIKGGQQQQTFQVSTNNQIIHQNQNTAGGTPNTAGQIIQKVNMPRNVHVVARVQSVNQQSQQQSQQQQNQNQLMMQPKYIQSGSTPLNKTSNINMIKKQTVNQMKVQHHKISNVNVAGQQQQQQQQVKTFIHQQSQPSNPQFSTVINQNIQPATLNTTKQIKTQQKIVKQFNNTLSNATTLTLMQQQTQQQPSQQISTSGTYTINNKISGLPIQQHQRIVNANSKNALNQNATTKYVMQNHIVIPSTGNASNQQTANNLTGTSAQPQKPNTNLNNLTNSIVVNQQIINTVNNNHTNHGNASGLHQQQLQPQSGTIKFVNAHGTVLQTHQPSTNATIIAANNQQTRIRNQNQQQMQNNQQYLENNNNTSGKLNSVNDNHVLYQIQQPTTTFLMNQQSTNSSVVLQGNQSQQRSQTNNAISDNIVIVNGTKMTDEDSARILQSMALKSYGNQRFQQQQQQQPHQQQQPQTRIIQNSQLVQQINNQSTQPQQNYVISREFQFPSNQQQQSSHVQQHQQQQQPQQQYQGFQIQNTSAVKQSQISNQSNSSTRSQLISERKRERESKAAAAAAIAAANAAAVAATVNVSQPTTQSTNTNTSEFFRVNSNEIHKNYYSQPTCPTIIDNIPLPRGDNTPAAQQIEHDDDIIGEEVRPVPITTHDSRLQALHAFLQDHTYVVPMPSLLPKEIITSSITSSLNTAMSGSSGTTIAAVQPQSITNSGQLPTTIANINSNKSSPLQQQQIMNTSTTTGHNSIISQYQSSQLQQQQQVQATNNDNNALLINSNDKSVVCSGNLLAQNIGILSNSSSGSNNGNKNNLIGNIVQLQNSINSGKNLNNVANMSGSLNSSIYSSQSGQQSHQHDDDANSVISNDSHNASNGRLEMDLGEETETAPEAEAEDDSVTRCICDLTHDDGYMICCDKCFTWQHVDCMKIDRTNIPDEYLCEICQPRQVDKVRARTLQLVKRKEMQAALLSNMNYNSSNAGTGNMSTTNSSTLQDGQITANNSPTENIKIGKKGKPKKSELLKKTNAKKERVQKRKETKRVNKRKTKGYDFKATDKNADNLQQWIENYEVAVTNHYSPELRARLQAIAKQPNLLQAINAHENKWLRNYYGKFDMDSKGTVIPHGGGKILISNMDIMPNSPIIELRGKYMLTTQFKTPNITLNMNSPPPSLLTASRNNRIPGPFIFFYQLPVDSASLAAASGANASRGIAALAAAAAVTTASGLSTEICVDTRTYGNEARFVRRSCKPNAELQYSFEKGAIHLFIVSLSNIISSTEITIRHEPHDLMALETKTLHQNLYIAPTSTICACGLAKECAFGQLPQLPSPILESTFLTTKKKSKKSLLNGTLSSKTRAGVKKNKKLQNTPVQRGRSSSSSAESQNESLNPNKLTSSANNNTAVINTNLNNIENLAPITNNYISKLIEEPCKYNHESLTFSTSTNVVSSPQMLSPVSSTTQNPQLVQQTIISTPTQLLSPINKQPPQMQVIPTIIQPILQQTQQNLSALTLKSPQQAQQVLIPQISQDKAIQPISLAAQQQIHHIVQILPSSGLNSPTCLQQQPVMQLIPHSQIELTDTRKIVEPEKKVEIDQQVSEKIINVVNDIYEESSKRTNIEEKINQHLQVESSQAIAELQLKYPQKPPNGQFLTNQEIDVEELNQKLTENQKTLQTEILIEITEVDNSVLSKDLDKRTKSNKEPSNNKIEKNLNIENKNILNKIEKSNELQSIVNTNVVDKNPNSNLNNDYKNINNISINSDNLIKEIIIDNVQTDISSGNKISFLDISTTKNSPQKSQTKKFSKSRTTSASEDNTISNADQINTASTSSEANHRESRKLTREERKMEAIVKAIEKMEKNQQRKNELSKAKTVKGHTSTSPSSPKRTKTNSQSEDGGDDEKNVPTPHLKSTTRKPSLRKKKRKGNRSYAMHTTQKKRRRSRLNSNDSEGGTSDDSTSVKSPPVTPIRQLSKMDNSNELNLTNIFSAPAQYQQYNNVPQNSQQNHMTLMADLIKSQSQTEDNISDDSEAVTVNATNQEAGLLLAFANVDKTNDDEQIKISPKRQTRNSAELRSPQISSPAISSACLLIESALGPLENLNNDESSDSFKIPSKTAKTKKSLMSYWLNQSTEDQEIESAENKALNDANTLSSNTSMMNFSQSTCKGFETLVQAAMVDYKPPIVGVNSLSFIPHPSKILQQTQIHIGDQPILSSAEDNTDNLCLAAKKVEEFIIQNDYSSSQGTDYLSQNTNIQLIRDTDSPSSLVGFSPDNQPAMNSCSNSAAKKRWLRQAISEETDEHQNILTSASNSPTSQLVPNGYTTPLKKRRLVVRNDKEEYTDDMICDTPEDISLEKNGSDSSLSNDDYKEIKAEIDKSKIKNVLQSEIKNELKASDSSSADVDVDILGFSSPSRKINIEDDYKLVKIEPEDEHENIKIDVEKEETLHSSFDSSFKTDETKTSIKLESINENKSNLVNKSDSDNKYEIKNKIQKEENLFTAENTLLEKNVIVKESKGEIQTNDGQKINCIKKITKNFIKQNSKTNKKPNTPISLRNKIISPIINETSMNNSIDSAKHIVKNLDKTLQSDEIADIQKTLHSFHTENIMLLQKRNKKTKKMDLNSTKEKYNSKKDKTNNLLKDSKLLKKDLKDNSFKKDKNNKKRLIKDDILNKHNKNEANIVNKVNKVVYAKKDNDYVPQQTPNEEIHETVRKIENEDIRKSPPISNPQYILTPQDILNSPNLQNSTMRVNQTPQHQIKILENVQSNYSIQNISSLSSATTGNGEYPSQTFNFGLKNNAGQQTHSLTTGLLPTQTICNPILNSQSSELNLPYYNTVYGKLLDPNKSTPNSSNLLPTANQFQTTLTTPQLATPNLLLSEYKSYSTLGAYVTSSSSYLSGSCGISPTTLTLGSSVTSSNNTSGKNVNTPSSLLDIGIPKIITKTASQDPRLNPQLTIPEPAPVPKRKLSINEYRKRKLQSSESTVNSFESSDSNSSNNVNGGKKIETFDDQMSDSTKVQFSPAPTLLEKQQEILCERLKSFKQQKNQLAGSKIAATLSTSTSINNNNNIVVIGGDGGGIDAYISVNNNCTNTLTTTVTTSSNFNINSTLSSSNTSSLVTNKTLINNNNNISELNKESKVLDELNGTILIKSQFTTFNNNNSMLSLSSNSTPSSPSSITSMSSLNNKQNNLNNDDDNDNGEIDDRDDNDDDDYNNNNNNNDDDNNNSNKIINLLNNSINELETNIILSQDNNNDKINNNNNNNNNNNTLNEISKEVQKIEIIEISTKTDAEDENNSNNEKTSTTPTKIISLDEKNH